MACALGAGFSSTAAAKAGASAAGAPIVVVSGEEAAAFMGVGAGSGGAREAAMDIPASGAAAGSRVAVPSAATALIAGCSRAGVSAWGAPIVPCSGEINAALAGVGAGGGGACATGDEADFDNGDEIAGKTAGAREATVVLVGVLAGCADSRATTRFTAIVTGWRDV